MDEYYFLERKEIDGNSVFRFVSLLNGAKGLWMSKMKAKMQGEKHKKLIIKIIKGDINE